MVCFDSRRLWGGVRLGAFLALSIFAFAASPARAQSDSAEYEQQVDAALADHEAGRFEAAREHFLRAHAVFPSARTLRGLGKVEFELHHYSEAIDYLEQALQSPARALPPDLRDEVSALIERAREQQGPAEVKPAPPPPPVVELATGPRVQVMQSPVAMHQDAPAHRKWWLWTAGGVVLAGSVTAAVLIATRDHDNSDPYAGSAWVARNP